MGHEKEKDNDCKISRFCLPPKYIYIVPILIAVFVLEEKMIFFCIGAAENILQEYIRDYNA